MKKRKYFPGVLALAAVCAVASAGIGKTWSYFTTYTEAAGGYPIQLGDRTDITEDFTEWTKHVTIANEPGSEPVYIRAKAFCGSQYTITYSGEGWTWNEEDGYYYYNYAVEGGKSTESLNLKIDGIPEDLERFNVVVIYESTPVKYHEDGSAYTVEETDWDEILDTGSTESSGGADGAEGEGNGDAEGGEA
ncbi:MAG: hypothetical protein HFH92_07565 [Lachnospiraceae bacterium]|uniref:hypothetical protein n=1 Tax=uncultured Acetatifactor sp. TaxID=1671927 RepID=UPI002604551A|nr:hypothetical protein [uncultured Acetatifactor sp.]MCI8788949.1 hypothetical protein [Lachnospiraceae bacterium]